MMMTAVCHDRKIVASLCRPKDEKLQQNPCESLVNVIAKAIVGHILPAQRRKSSSRARVFAHPNRTGSLI
jgi:hypothetical protein